ncbi:MAG: hypothetical protein ACKO3N_17425 [Verrucomicrobiota bacterium]
MRAPVTPALAPFVEQRAHDAAAEFKRYAVYPLPQAVHQKQVRRRFAHAGTDSCCRGIGVFGLYRLSSMVGGPGREVLGSCPQVILADGASQWFRVLR